MDANQSYFKRSEVSNSDLTELKNILYPSVQYGDKERAFKFGSLIDAMVTEPHRVDYFQMKVDEVEYTVDDFELGKEMLKALRTEAKKDPFLDNVLKLSDTQKHSIRKQQEFQYGGFTYHLDTRCKWDWWLPQFHFGGDLKTTFAESQKQFDEAVDFFDWDRSRSWYMDIENTTQDFVYAISKKNCKVFKHFIKRGDAVYERGKEKYNELAFKWWMLFI
ncbi:MAG: hypothetical protein JXQ69_03675 [Paludibacteraceae bacterium]|nr:hypothetical protein [Paludibacteraceae bacterium]